MLHARYSCLLTAALLSAGCGGGNGGKFEVRAVMAEGTFKVASGQGYAPADEAAILRITARLDRSADRLVFTLADGTQRSMPFSSRPPSQWKPDCYTMNSHILCEVADLGPGPLQLLSLSFSTPLVYAKCDPKRVILANTGFDQSVSLVFIQD